jgi:hypothetical protein
LSRSAFYQRFGLLFRVKPEVEVVKIVADLRQILGDTSFFRHAGRRYTALTAPKSKILA